MKPIVPITTVLVILLFVSFSCSHQKESAGLLPELQQAEVIMYAHPDSALMILERMPVPSASDRLQHATWCILVTQAKHKNFHKQYSDSLIQIASDYFMEQDDPQRKALVLHYKGALSLEWGSVEDAQKFHLQALKYAEQTTDYQLSYLVAIELGNIYAYRSLYDYAESYFQKALHYAELSENKVYISGALSYIGRVYGGKKRLDAAVEQYGKAVDVARATNDNQILCGTLGELSSLYLRKGEHALAVNCIREVLDIEEKHHMDKSQSFKTIGEIYLLSEKADSAYYYFQMASSSDNIYTKCGSYHYLSDLSREKEDYRHALEYMDEYLFYADSIQKLDRSDKLIEMQEKYSQEKILNEKNQLKIEKNRIERNLLCIFVAFLCIMAVIIYNYQYKLIRKGRTIQKNEEKMRQYSLKIHENEALIHRNKSRMQELAAEIEQNQEIQEQMEELQLVMRTIRSQNEELHQENKSFQDRIAASTSSSPVDAKELEMLKQLSEENQRLQDREKFLCNQCIKRIEVLNKLKYVPKAFDSVCWSAVCEAIDELYNNYTMRLQRAIPSLSESDMQVCCLVKLQLSVSDMAVVLGISSTSVSKRKLRLKEHIQQDLGEPLGENQTLDLWLQEY